MIGRDERAPTVYSFLVTAARTLLVSVFLFCMLAARPTDCSAAAAPVIREVAISAAIIGTAFLLDPTVEPGFPDRVPQTLAEEPGEVFGGATLLIGGTAVMATYGAAFDHPGALQTAKRLGLAMGATTVTVWAIKFGTQRERPDGSDHYSFPSGHTAVAFAAAAVLDRQYGGAVGWFAYGAAALAGEARIADNHHYLSDVVAGAVLGRLIGRLVTLDR